jgi:hypothetical protein
MASSSKPRPENCPSLRLPRRRQRPPQCYSSGTRNRRPSAANHLSSSSTPNPPPSSISRPPLPSCCTQPEHSTHISIVPSKPMARVFHLPK